MRSLHSLLLLAFVAAGCSTAATLNRTQTSNAYANRMKLKALVYLAPEIQQKKLTINATSQDCAGWTAEIDGALGYRTAVESGLAAALQEVEMVSVPVTAEMAAQRNADLLISVSPTNELANISATGGNVNAQFQTSLLLSYADRNGMSLYSYTANGSGFNNISGTCNELAQVLKQAMETALRQVADYISQSTFSASQLRDLEKSVVRR